MLLKLTGRKNVYIICIKPEQTNGFVHQIKTKECFESEETNVNQYRLNI